MGHYAKRFFKQGNIRKNLFIEYLMNGNVLDSSGNGYNGTATGISYVPNRKGVLTSAAEFIENTDSILMGYTGTLASYTTPWTVNVWVYTTGVNPTANTICILKGTTYPILVCIGTNASYLGLGFGSVSGGVATAKSRTGTPTSFFLNNWVMCTISYNGLGESDRNNYKLYENGVLKTNLTTAAFGNYSNTNTIGKVVSATVLTHKGYIDDFRYWTRELTQTEITKLYNE